MELKDIRLACYLLDEITRHLVLQSFTLDVSRISNKIKWLASGVTAFSETTQILRIKGLILDRAALRYATNPFPKAAHKAQTKFLCSAIASLKEVKTAM